jgi:hypothetical protein
MGSTVVISNICDDHDHKSNPKTTQNVTGRRGNNNVGQFKPNLQRDAGGDFQITKSECQRSLSAGGTGVLCAYVPYAKVWERGMI